MKWLSLFIVFILLWSACTTESVTPTRNSREVIDSLYQRQIILLQPRMDSLCAAMSDSIFKLSVDSIMSTRQVEMINLVK